jgi:solute:Na+ symporter, SSS family
MPIAQIDIGFILAYIVLVIAVGVWSARKQSPTEYLIHGRSLNTWQFIASTTASWIGGGTLVAYAAYVYEFGFAVVAASFGSFVGMCLFIPYAQRLRREGHQHQYLTLSDYFYHKVGKQAGVASALLLSFVVSLFILSNFIAGSAILSVLSGWSYDLALAVCAVVILVYLFLGGMKSVVKTDIFQYLIMVILTLTVGIAMLRKTGIDPELLSLSNVPVGLLVAFMVLSLIGPFYSAHTWQRIYAVKDDRSVKFGLVGAGACLLLIGIAITLVGLAARTGFPDISPKDAAAYGMMHLLPPGLLGLGLVTLFAATMSSVDTFVFYLSSSIAKDYLGHLLGQSTERELHSATRILIVVVTLFSASLAYIFRDLVDVLLTFVGVAVALVPPVIASFHVKLKQNAVVAALLVPCLYTVLLVVTGRLAPELVTASLLVSALTLFAWQKWGK